MVDANGVCTGDNTLYLIITFQRIVSEVYAGSNPVLTTRADWSQQEHTPGEEVD